MTAHASFADIADALFDVGMMEAYRVDMLACCQVERRPGRGELKEARQRATSIVAAHKVFRGLAQSRLALVNISAPHMGLTPRQYEVLSVIKGLVAKQKNPSRAEIAAATGLSSRGALQRILVRLRDRGHIRWVYGCGRSIAIVEHIGGAR
jgi:hypothetical protein